MNDTFHCTMGELLETTARRFPERDALVYPDRGLRYTWRTFDQEVDKIARGLIGLGLGKGDHVAIWASNVPEWVVLQFATAKIGAVLVTINTSYQAAELEYILKQSDARMLFMVGEFKGSDYLDIIRRVVPGLKQGKADCASLPSLREVIFLGEACPPDLLPYQRLRELAHLVDSSQLDQIKTSLDEGDVINMQYTSGTTGFPKGVMLTHHNIINNGYNIGKCMEFSHEDRLCIPVPFFHCFGCVLGVMACVTHGATMVPVEIFDPLEVLQAIEAEACTAVHGVPTMFIAELEHPRFSEFDLSTLRTGIMAGSPCPTEVMRRVIDDMHCSEITIAYGQTEASPVITQTRTNDPLELRVASVGRALPDVEVKIVDIESGEELAAGQQGELCTRGYLVMKGYYKMEEATAAAIDPEGWLHTGDLAVMDAQGYCKITGRIKNMIIRGGENIYPREIEEFLYRHPKISDVQVYGVPDLKYGEQVMAAIKLKEGESCTADEIREFCKGEIARYKVPRYVTFVESYPMTASGKIQKFKLREQAIADLDLPLEGVAATEVST